ncbi:MBL fold metallo-hydrolase [Thalassotalea sp. G2M2-11]|uniref:MBL fold metallo-hydrolase n=1 Tax=Thalassotalea sp. G2M2-11 TaxID=2787627 RepID=UPI0019D1505B|nr:MBL fold metallo-hydrolase [Thalassotalea sp. G2M2-11]
MFKKSWLSLCVIALTLTSVHAQDMSDVEIKTTAVAGNVYMLTGAGGNIGVLATEAGLLLVDDQFQPLAKKIEAAMQGINNNQLKYIVNTHYHGDHTGSNAFFSHKAPIFAHQNVRSRLQAEQDHQTAALPVVTYDNGVTIYLQDEEVQLIHFPAGHTDGDTVVYFKQANVLHTGDLFFELGFPYIDLDGGGSVKGYLANVNQLLAMMPDDVAIIPGHGQLTDKAGYSAFAKMIDFSIKRVSKALAEGKSEQQILAAGIGEQYKDQAWSFISEERWLKTLIKGLK